MVKRSEKGYILAKKGFKEGYQNGLSVGSLWEKSPLSALSQSKVNKVNPRSV